MSQITLDFLPPDNWQDFERLTRSLCAIEWGDNNAETVGRPGQAQNGVDVVGWDHRRDSWTRIGVQCKRRSDRASDGVVKAGGALTLSDVSEEVEKSEACQPKLSHFVMATTASQDAPLQQSVAALHAERRQLGKSGVSMWFWEWFQERLNRHIEIVYQFYSDLLRSQGTYDPDQHTVSMMRAAFDRPLMMTPFHMESSVGAVDNGLSRLQQFLSTGFLKDREGETVSSSPPPRQLSNAEERKVVASLRRDVQTLRNDFADCVSRNIIVDQGYMVEVRDPQVCDRMNSARANMIVMLNTLFDSYSLPPIESELLE